MSTRYLVRPMEVESQSDPEEDLVAILEDSPWERGMREAESGVHARAEVDIPCDWCGMFAALPGSPRCSICVPVDEPVPAKKSGKR